jgi:uncharacterized protein (DUF2164 family)
MGISLTDEKRELLVDNVRELFREEFERELSPFQAERLLDFFVRRLGPPVYNQAIQDARVHMQLKLDDLDGEVYEPEEPA